MSTELAVAESPYMPTALILRDGLTFEEWSSLGATLGTMERGINWWIGDWVNYGEHTYGEKYTQAVQETGRDKDTIANLAWVAGRIETSRRRENLTWSHHAEVASLGVEDQERMLDKAESEGWSTRALRDAVQDAKKNALPAPKQEPAPSANTETPSAPESDDGPDLLAELEEADKRIRHLEAENASLVASVEGDTGTELRKLHARVAQLEGRIQGLITEANEAKQQAKRQASVLSQLRKLLKVERDRDLIDAVERLAR